MNYAGTDGLDRETTLLETLRDTGYPLRIWTEGDRKWQNRKCLLTGVYEYVPPEHIHCSPKNKSALLPEIAALACQVYGEGLVFMVVDDKESNISLAQDALANTGAVISRQ